MALAHAQHALHHDDLTATLNRRGFRRACDLLPTAGPHVVLSCAMVDLDDFKLINDTYGHPVGDAALTHFSAMLRAQLRPQDTVARLGGDEFAVLLADTRGGDAARILSRVQDELQRNPCGALPAQLSLIFSAGVAERLDHEPLACALARADNALLEAKRRGKGRLVRCPASGFITNAVAPDDLRT